MRNRLKKHEHYRLKLDGGKTKTAVHLFKLFLRTKSTIFHFNLFFLQITQLLPTENRLSYIFLIKYYFTTHIAVKYTHYVRENLENVSF